MSTTPPPNVAIEIELVDTPDPMAAILPATGEVRAGALVRWTNHDRRLRGIAAKAGSFRSPLLAPGESFTWIAVGGRHEYTDVAVDGSSAVIVVE